MRYTATENSLLNNVKFLTLSPMEQLIYFHLRHAPGQTALGCLVFWSAEFAQKLRMEIGAIEAIVGRLAAEGWIAFDAETRLLYIRGHWAVNGFTNELSVRGAMGRLEELPDSPVLSMVAEELAARRAPKKPGMAEALRDLLYLLQKRGGAWLPGWGPAQAPGGVTGGLFDGALDGVLNSPLNDMLDTPSDCPSDGATVTAPVPATAPAPDRAGAREGEGGEGFRVRMGSGKGRLMAELSREELDWYATTCRASDHKAAAVAILRQREQAHARAPDTRPLEERYQEMVDPATRPMAGTPEYAELVRRRRIAMGLSEAGGAGTTIGTALAGEEEGQGEE